jgi:hypothetical protein
VAPVRQTWPWGTSRPLRSWAEGRLANGERGPTGRWVDTVARRTGPVTPWANRRRGARGDPGRAVSSSSSGTLRTAVVGRAESGVEKMESKQTNAGPAKHDRRQQQQ